MNKFAFKLALFDKPSGVDFDAIVAAMDGIAFGLGGFGVGFTKIDVFEERAGARFGSGIGKFDSANGRDGGTNTGGAGVGDIVFGQVIFDRLIEGTRHLAWVKL